MEISGASKLSAPWIPGRCCWFLENQRREWIRRKPGTMELIRLHQKWIQFDHFAYWAWHVAGLGVCGALYVLDYGQVIAEGTPAEIRSNKEYWSISGRGCLINHARSKRYRCVLWGDPCFKKVVPQCWAGLHSNLNRMPMAQQVYHPWKLFRE
jgi:hypothetical protein